MHNSIRFYNFIAILPSVDVRRGADRAQEPDPDQPLPAEGALQPAQHPRRLDLGAQTQAQAQDLLHQDARGADERGPLQEPAQAEDQPQRHPHPGAGVQVAHAAQEGARRQHGRTHGGAPQPDHGARPHRARPPATTGRPRRAPLLPVLRHPPARVRPHPLRGQHALQEQDHQLHLQHEERTRNPLPLREAAAGGAGRPALQAVPAADSGEAVLREGAERAGDPGQAHRGAVREVAVQLPERRHHPAQQRDGAGGQAHQRPPPPHPGLAHAQGPLPLPPEDAVRVHRQPQPLRGTHAARQVHPAVTPLPPEQSSFQPILSRWLIWINHFMLLMMDSKTPMVFSALLRERQRGPRTRMRCPLWPPFPKSTPASLPFSKTWASASRFGSFLILSFTNSTAISMPFPRTSPRIGLLCAIRRNSVCRQVPISSDRSANFSSRRMSSTSMPRRHSSGPPAKVGQQSWVRASAISRRVATAEKGVPLPMALAMTTMSGLTSCHLKPQDSLPILQKPVWTSSEMQSPPMRLTSLCSVCTYSFCRGMMPPAPITGSIHTPASFPLVLLSSCSSASLISDSTELWAFLQKLGQASRSRALPLARGVVQVPMLVRLQALPAVPWQPLRRATTMLLRVYDLARLQAKSLASLPELKKNTVSRSLPSSLQSFSAYSPWQGWVQWEDMLSSLSFWVWQICVMRGCEWPMFMQEMPPMRSMYSRPF